MAYIYFNLRETLDPISFEFVEARFELEVTKDKDICGFNAYGGSDWIKFFQDGTASYSDTGSVKDAIPFASHQDAVDFIRI